VPPALQISIAPLGLSLQPTPPLNAPANSIIECLRMEKPLITDFRMHDGSRHFVSLPESEPLGRVLWHVFGSGFAMPYFFFSSWCECWIDFWYRGQSLHNQ
jgi:hypothetical protein